MGTTGTIFKAISDSGSSRLTWTGLTPDILEKARSRVRTLAWLTLAVLVLGGVTDLLYAGLVIGKVEPIWVGVVLAGAVLSLALILAANSPRLEHLTVLHLSLAYEVAICLILAVMMPWMMYLEIADVPYVTWVTPFIILFPLIVPSPPRMTLVAALAAAATRPLGLLILEEFVGMEIAGIRYIGSIFSPTFAVAVAYVGSRIVHGLNVDLARARKMGSYELESRLGAGGMGEVWRARHRLLARPAAVKLVRLENVANDPESRQMMLARFEREAQATAVMCSPHTIQLFDFGVEQGGTFYYAMELLNGLDLDDLVTRFGPLPPARTVHILLQVCDSLGEAHEHGLIHRDIKPANIYLCHYGRRFDFVKVLDFGLVKFHRQVEEAVTKLTSEFAVGGTPAYIAPEQVLGEEIDGRADIYSLGCVAYWMLTGKNVFEGKTAMQTMLQHVRSRPREPSSRTAQNVPRSLDQIVLSCLEKDPDQRPQDVDKLAESLLGCDLDPTWSQDQAHQWWEEHLPRRTTSPRPRQKAVGEKSSIQKKDPAGLSARASHINLID